MVCFPTAVFYEANVFSIKATAPSFVNALICIFLDFGIDGNVFGKVCPVQAPASVRAFIATSHNSFISLRVSVKSVLIHCLGIAS